MKKYIMFLIIAVFAAVSFASVPESNIDKTEDPMAYITQADLEAKVGTKQLSELTGETDGLTINATKLNEAIAESEGIIDGYCGSKYKVPFADGSVPKIVESIDKSLTIYYLRKNRNLLNDKLTEDYNRNINLLKDVSVGKISLGVDADGELWNWHWNCTKKEIRYHLI